MKKEPRHVRRLVQVLTAVLAAGAVAPAAALAAECPAVPTTQLFAAQGDTNDYFVPEGGDFDLGLLWARTGTAELDDGWSVNGLAGGKHLEMRNGSTVTSLTFCVDVTHPHLRFVFKRASDTQGDITVQAVEGATVTTLGTVTGPRSTTLSPNIELAPKLGVPPGEARIVQLRFVARSSWDLDTIAVDPRRAG